MDPGPPKCACSAGGPVIGFVWVLFFAVGCTRVDPITFWQDHLASYIELEGNGDPAVLRDQPDLHSPRRDRPSQITFATSPSGGRDARGILVGVRNVGGEPWYFFLVGVTRHSGNAFSRTEDVRLAAFTLAGHKLKWRVSSPHEASLRQYRSGRIDAARAGVPTQVGFPAPLDVFHLVVSEGVVTITEQRSGAKWRLPLPRDGR
ncbi:MAG: hypothetical protein IID37_15045 [Planctomycetes bacterium]|nr:hypothetical protein [Planctomycetota bacterium]